MIVDYNEIGIKAFQEKRYEDAAQAFTQAIEANPEEAIGYINFGNLLAAMMEEVNMTKHKHIITIEDPIEYVFTPQNCIFEQKQL